MTIRLLISLLLFTGFCRAQAPTLHYKNNLSKRVTFNVNKQRVGDVLQQISKAGDFYFAYSGALFGQDSIVSLTAKSLPVRDVLDQLFDGKVAYKENDKYIILRYAVNHLTIEAENIITAENFYQISGFVIDTQTGKRIKQASVYEKKLLQSTLTDQDGNFTLKFKGEHSSIILTASKETYRDTSLIFLSNVNIKPSVYDDPDKEKGTFFANAIEELGIGRFFLSSKQKIQSINIPNFLATTPFQASLTPGLSSHGMLSSSVVNKVSLNVLGGYTAGVDGVEVAGLFNLTKGDVKSLQLAGLFNAVGNDIAGVQIGGLSNLVRGNLKGIQVAGLQNSVRGEVNGFQVAGLGNIASSDFRGIQIAGIANITSRNMNGIQISGIGNITSRTLRGMQIGLFNLAKNNTGFQIGLINVAGSANGTSFGLVNIVKNGYHKISLSTNELINANVSLKTGNSNLYTILLGGKNYSDTAKIETFGIGFGHDFIFNRTFSIATELTVQQLHLGNWDYANLLSKFQASLQLQVIKGLSIFGGPTYNYYISDAPNGSSSNRYKQQIVPAKHAIFRGNPGWIGWNVGITIF